MKIGFLGCGNMGGALARAVALCPGNELVLADKLSDKAERLAEEIGARGLKDGDIDELYNCDLIFVGVKPVGVAAALADIKRARKSTEPPVVVSMAAGVKIKDIESALPAGSEVIRIMPNTPVSVSEGMVLYSLGSSTKEGTERTFTEIMSGAGKLMRLGEELIDKATAISGCGPAYAFMFLEAMIDGGIAIGLPYELAKALATQTMLGSAKMAGEAKEHPAALRNAVCSPGGSTIEGVIKLEDGGLRSAVEDAVIAAYEKTKKLGENK